MLSTLEAAQKNVGQAKQALEAVRRGGHLPADEIAALLHDAVDALGHAERSLSFEIMAAQRPLEVALRLARQARQDVAGHSGEAAEALRIAIYALGSAHSLLLMEDAWQRQPDRPRAA